MRVLRYLTKIAPQVAINLNIAYDRCECVGRDSFDRLLVLVSLNVVVNGRRTGICHLNSDDGSLWCSIPLAGFDHRVFRDEYRQIIQNAVTQLQERLRSRNLHDWLIERQLQRIVRVLNDAQHLQRLNQEEGVNG